jgi:YfiH family protein
LRISSWKISRGIFLSPELSAQKWLKHGFGTRSTEPDLRAPRWKVVRAKQVHSDIIHVVDDPNKHGPAKLRGDALVTAVPGLALAVSTADCLPVLLADPENHVVAAIHAGWRGTLRRITQKTVGLMRMRFGSDPAKLMAAFGPGIQVGCYEVGMDVVDEFRSQFSDWEELFDKLEPVNPALVMLPRQHLAGAHAVMRELEDQHAFLNVEEANLRQLLEAGVTRAHIGRGAPCTACRVDLLHSYRKEGPGQGHQSSAIGIVERK